jgi:hypothetical protein
MTNQPRGAFKALGAYFDIAFLVFMIWIASAAVIIIAPVLLAIILIAYLISTVLVIKKLITKGQKDD